MPCIYIYIRPSSFTAPDLVTLTHPGNNSKRITPTFHIVAPISRWSIPE